MLRANWHERPVRTYRALATDYDGTIACEGRVDEPTVAALDRARGAGLRLLLVTGRQLTDLVTVFDHYALFDFIVAENGAVVHDSGSNVTQTIAAAPPPGLITSLTRQGVPLSVGRSIVATAQPYEHLLRSAISDLALEWHVILNKGSVMALPSTVTKATGLAATLVRAGLRPDQTVGVGDAENDEDFLRGCGLAVAVANALPSVKALAHMTTSRGYGAGVSELIGQLLSGEL